MKCPKCGNTLPTGAKFCGKCGTVISAGSAPETGYDTGRRPTHVPEKPTSYAPMDPGSFRMAQGIAMGYGEKVVRRYNIGRYSFGKGSVDVIVTNKRVIRYQESNWLGLGDNVIDEINLDVVHGVSTTLKRSISSIGLTTSLMFLIMGIFAFTTLTGG